jgi:MSHA biogenesis protein MshP
MSSMRSTQHGFAAIAAVFLVVILAALGAFMLTFSNTQQLTSAQDVQGSRAYWAARAGLEWVIAGVVATAPVAPAVAPAPKCPVSPPVTIETFSMVITCAIQTYDEDGVTRHIFQFSSVAHSAAAAGSVGYIERSLSAAMEI